MSRAAEIELLADYLEERPEDIFYYSKGAYGYGRVYEVAPDNHNPELWMVFNETERYNALKEDLKKSIENLGWYLDEPIQKYADPDTFIDDMPNNVSNKYNDSLDWYIGEYGVKDIGREYKNGNIVFDLDSLIDSGLGDLYNDGEIFSTLDGTVEWIGDLNGQDLYAYPMSFSQPIQNWD